MSTTSKSSKDDSFRVILGLSDENSGDKPKEAHKWKNQRHLILDVDETLGHAFVGETCLKKLKESGLYDDPAYIEHRDRVRIIQVKDPGEGWTGSGCDLDMWFVKRPGLDEFLCFAFEYFDTVGIWSAGVDNYVKDICSVIFVSHRGIPRPFYVWSRERCSGNMKTLSKPLTKVFEAHPEFNMSLANTILLDDKAQNIIANPNNGVINPRFDPKPTVESMIENDEVLPKLMAWLSRREVMEADDIREVDKSNIFNHSLVELFAGN